MQPALFQAGDIQRGFEQVRLGYHPQNRSLGIDDGCSRNVALQHQGRSLFHRPVRVNGDRRVSHDAADLDFGYQIEQFVHFQTGSVRGGGPLQVTVGHHAAERASVDHRQHLNPVFLHQGGSVLHGIVLINRNHRLAHPVSDQHGFLRLLASVRKRSIGTWVVSVQNPN